MFSGIVEELGEVKTISRRGRVTLLEVKADGASQDIKAGDSICVNGACLTVIKKGSGAFSFEVMPQTLEITNLGALKIKDKVNLERALKIGDRLSGHFVTGHIDCTGTIRRKGYIRDNLYFEVAVPQKFMGNIIAKGSIAVDGVSLTVVTKRADTFTVYIIPHTLQQTTLKFRNPSDRVNIEFDILTKKV